VVSATYYDPYTHVPGARRLELDELLATSDLVTLHAPATDQAPARPPQASPDAGRDGALMYC
jgi:lactate dehydrogenase-like 2-hydroxyacid dehydrogenase